MAKLEKYYFKKTRKNKICLWTKSCGFRAVTVKYIMQCWGQVNLLRNKRILLYHLK